MPTRGVVDETVDATEQLIALPSMESARGVCALGPGIEKSQVPSVMSASQADLVVVGSPLDSNAKLDHVIAVDSSAKVSR